MSNILKNWKTTSAGLLSIIGAITSLFFVPINPATISAAATAFLAGVGLLLAADNNNNTPTSNSKQNN